MSKTKRQREASDEIVRRSYDRLRPAIISCKPHICERANHAYEPGAFGVCKRCGGQENP